MIASDRFFSPRRTAGIGTLCATPFKQKKTKNAPYDKASLHKEIELIHGCISRMAQNSFAIKGWAITLISIMTIILQWENKCHFLTLSLLIPLGSFWWLDAYFLRLERQYRKMYDWVLDNRTNKNNYECLYNLNPNRFKEQVGSTFSVAISFSLGIFYGLIFVFIVVISFIQILTA